MHLAGAVLTLLDLEPVLQALLAVVALSSTRMRCFFGVRGAFVPIIRGIALGVQDAFVSLVFRIL